MLVQLNPANVLNMRKLISTSIGTRKIITKIPSSLFGLFPTFTEKETEEWTLNIKYVCGASNKEMVAAWTCPNRSELENMVQNMMKQIKDSSSDMVNQAFEDAFLKG